MEEDKNKIFVNAMVNFGYKRADVNVALARSLGNEEKAMEWLWENIHPMFITDPSAESSKAEAGESADGSEMAEEFNITDPNAEASKAEASGLAEGSGEWKVETRLPIVGDLTRAFCREDGKYYEAVVTDGPSVEGSYKVVFVAFQRTEYESREENVSSQEIEPTGTHLPIINYRLGNPSTDTLLELGYCLKDCMVALARCDSVQEAALWLTEKRETLTAASSKRRDEEELRIFAAELEQIEIAKTLSLRQQHLSDSGETTTSATTSAESLDQTLMRGHDEATKTEPIQQSVLPSTGARNKTSTHSLLDEIVIFKALDENPNALKRETETEEEEIIDQIDLLDYSSSSDLGDGEDEYSESEDNAPTGASALSNVTDGAGITEKRVERLKELFPDVNPTFLLGKAKQFEGQSEYNVQLWIQKVYDEDLERTFPTLPTKEASQADDIQI